MGPRQAPLLPLLAGQCALALAVPSAVFGSAGRGRGFSLLGAAGLVVLAVVGGVWEAGRRPPPALTAPLRRAMLGCALFVALGLGAAWLSVLGAVAAVAGAGARLVGAVVGRHRDRRDRSAPAHVG